MALRDALRAIGRILLLLLLLGGGAAGIWYSARKLPNNNVPMAVTYAVLGLTALAFLMFGIFVTTFFARDSRLEAIVKTLDDMRKLITAAAKEPVPIQESSNSNAAFESLEKGIRRLQNQVETSNQVCSRLDTSLERLLKATEGIVAGLIGSQTQAIKTPPTPAPSHPAPVPAPAPAPAKPQEKPPAEAEEDPTAPAWRKALNNILEDIDEGQK